MKKNKGSLTIEAALTLPLIVFTVLAMCSFMKIMMVYDMVQTSVNKSVKTVSRFSYIANATGLKDITSGAEAHKDESGVANMFNLWTSTLGVFSDDGNIDLKETFKEMGDAIKNPNEIKNLGKSGKAIETTVATLLILFEQFTGVSPADGVSSFVNGTSDNILKAQAEAILIEDITGGQGIEVIDEKMKKLGIIKKSDDSYFSFENTKFRIGKDPEVTVVVSYSVEPSFKIFGIGKEYKITQRISMKPWVGVK